MTLGGLEGKLAACVAEPQRDRDYWKTTALMIQRNLAESHARECRDEWVRGHEYGIEDIDPMIDAATERLRRRVAQLEGRLARVLEFVSWGSRATRGRVWSGRRAGRGTKP